MFTGWIQNIMKTNLKNIHWLYVIRGFGIGVFLLSAVLILCHKEHQCSFYSWQWILPRMSSEPRASIPPPPPGSIRGLSYFFVRKELSLQFNLCGGWLEYLHRSPASRKRRQKGNPVPGGGGIAEPPCSWGI
jgi:hypothetical protein